MMLEKDLQELDEVKTDIFSHQEDDAGVRSASVHVLLSLSFLEGKYLGCRVEMVMMMNCSTH